MKPSLDPQQYREVQLLSNGKSGAVYLWKQRNGSELVAVSLSDSSEDRRDDVLFSLSFQGERFKPFFVQLVAQPWYETACGYEYLHLPFEYCDGGDLVPYLGVVEEPTIQRIVFYVATGLKFLHQRRILHRDIKAEHVLLTSKDIEKADFKLCDAGMARALGGNEAVDSAKDRSDCHFDYTVDVLSLGTLANDLAYGRPPAQATDAAVQCQRSLGRFSLELTHFIEATTSETNVLPTIEQALQLPFLASWRAQQTSALLTHNGLPRLDLLTYKTKRNCSLAVSHKPSSRELITAAISELEECVKIAEVCAGPDLPPPQLYEDLLTVNRFLLNY